MRQLWRLGATAVAGLVVGATTMLLVDAGPADQPGHGPDPSTVSVRPHPSDTGPTATSPTAGAGVTGDAGEPGEAAEPDRTVLAWTPGGLPAGFAATVAASPAVGGVTVVRGDPVTMATSLDPAGNTAGAAPPAGMVIDLDLVAVDPTTYPPFAEPVDRPALRHLAPGQALLGTTSAALRRLDAGDRVVLSGGASLTVAGVVDDTSIGAAEMVVTVATGAALGVTTERYLLARPSEAAGAGDATVRAVRAAAEPTATLRVRARGETPYLRSSDAVLPQSRIKTHFGEFAHLPLEGGRDLRQDRAWVDANIVEAEVPVLGRVRCHRLLIPALRGALQELADRNLAGLVQSYDGCYNPRLVRVGGTASRHAWGAAIDLNFSGNRTGTASIQDARLVDVMARWGFASGDGWLVPDPGHFEYVGPPRP